MASALTGDERVSPGVLPAGRYASLVYTGAFGSRVEFFLTDPDEESGQKKWETEVAIRLDDD